MSGGAIIRPLRADEEAAASRLIDIVFDRYLALIGLTTKGNLNPYDYLGEAIADGRAWAAEADGDLVGVAQVNAAGETWKLDLVGVLEGHAGAGIGRALMERVETDARARGISRLELHTLEVAEHLWRFYQRLGYVVIRRGPPAHGLDDNTRVFMEKGLR